MNTISEPEHNSTTTTSSSNMQKNSSPKKEDTSRNRFCPIWAYIDAVKKQPKEYTLTCQPECAFFDVELNTCSLKGFASNIAKYLE